MVRLIVICPINEPQREMARTFRLGPFSCWFKWRRSLAFLYLSSTYKAIAKQRRLKCNKKRHWCLRLPLSTHRKVFGNTLISLCAWWLQDRAYPGFCSMNRGVARGVLGCPWPPFVNHVLRKQPTTSVKNDMKIWWVTSFWHRVTPPLKNPGYAPDEAARGISIPPAWDVCPS